MCLQESMALMLILGWSMLPSSSPNCSLLESSSCFWTNSYRKDMDSVQVFLSSSLAILLRLSSGLHSPQSQLLTETRLNSKEQLSHSSTSSSLKQANSKPYTKPFTDKPPPTFSTCSPLSESSSSSSTSRGTESSSPFLPKRRKVTDNHTQSSCSTPPTCLSSSNRP